MANMPKIGILVFTLWGELFVCAASSAQEVEPHSPSLVVVIESHSQSVSASQLRSTISTLLGIPVVPLSSTKVASTDSIVCIYVNPERELSVLFHSPTGIDQSFTFTPESYAKDSAVSIANIVASLVRSYGIPQPNWQETLDRPDIKFNPYFDRWDSPEQYRPSYSLPPMNPYYYAPGGRRNRT